MATPIWGLTTPSGTDLVSQGDNAITDNANALDNATQSVTMLRKGVFVSRPTAATAKSGCYYLATDTNVLYLSDGTNWVPVATKLFEIGHNILVAGEIRVPVGQADVIPQLIVPMMAGQTVKLKRCRYVIASGTSATFKLQINGVDATGFTGMVAGTTVAETDPADIALASNDRLQVVVTAASGTPQNMTVLLVLEHTVV